jgi:hypothetical protein
MEATLADTRYEGRRKLAEFREPGRNFVLYANEEAPEIFVDGIAGLQGGGAISKLDLFVTTGVDQDDPTVGTREIRESKVRIVMSTAQLIEGLLNVVEQLRAQAPQLRAGYDQYAASMDAQLKKLGG